MPRLRLDTSLEMLLERLALSSAPAAVATIVSTAGSTYRKSGARMLIEADGRLTGLLSGGCLEQDLREHALAALAARACRVVEYDMRGDDDLVFGIGAGCEGAMRIVVEPADPGSRAIAALRSAGAALAAGESAALAVVHAGPDAELGTRAWPATAGLDAELATTCATVVATETSQHLRWDRERGAREAWIQYLAPAPRVLVCGAGADAEPLVAQLRALRFVVTVCDHRPAYGDPARFPGASVHVAPAAELAGHVDLARHYAAVVMSHHLASDAAYLAALAASPVEHIGLLGPRPRRERLMAQLGHAIAHQLAPRLRGPVGLDLGAVTPEGIALAIAAELHALAAGRPGGPSAHPASAT
ncbi:MAG TPA: XdhC family protein [Steroidobacteraceae bacterium]|nr:XdhC family protein [Steroidobacteraceae bacterium]